MKKQTTTSLASHLLFGCIAWMLLPGCPTESTGPLVSNNMGKDTNKKEMSDTSTGDMSDMVGVDTDMDASSGEMFCANRLELGMLDTSIAKVQKVSSDNMGAMLNGTSTTCGSSSAMERVMQFTVSGPVRIRTTITPKEAINWSLSMHTGDCNTHQEHTCVSDGFMSFVANAGTTYNIVAEPTNGSQLGSFDLELDMTPLACLPVGETICLGDDVERCEGGGATKTTYTCGAPCAQGGCGGDMCENAPLITSFPHRFTATATPYFNNFDFSNPHSCLNPDGGNEGELGVVGEPMSTLGKDVVFKLPGLKSGQKLTVDASADLGNTADSAIFILEDCTNLMTCHLAKDLTNLVSQWEVPKDGDYTVIVDRRSTSPIDIIVDINVE